REVSGHRVDGVGEIFPGARHTADVSLTAEFAVGADFASHAGDLGSERAELVHHGVERVFQLENFAFDVDRNFVGEVALCNGGCDFGDVTDLASQVAGHEVDVVGEVFPGAGDAGNLRLTAEFAFSADFASDASDFSSEGVELVHHRVDGVFQLENFALHVDGDFAREVAARHGGGDFGNVADLRCEVSGHRVD